MHLQKIKQRFKQSMLENISEINLLKSIIFTTFLPQSTSTEMIILTNYNNKWHEYLVSPKICQECEQI